MDRRHTGLFSSCGEHISVHYDVKITVARHMTGTWTVLGIGKYLRSTCHSYGFSASI